MLTSGANGHSSKALRTIAQSCPVNALMGLLTSTRSDSGRDGSVSFLIRLPAPDASPLAEQLSNYIDDNGVTAYGRDSFNDVALRT